MAYLKQFKKFGLILIIGLIYLSSYAQDCVVTFFTLGPIHVNNTAGSVEIVVNSTSMECHWNPRTDPVAPWVSLSYILNGTQGIIVTATYTENPTESQRIAKIWVNNKYIELKQAPTCSNEPRISITKSTALNRTDCDLKNEVMEARDYVKLTGNFTHSSNPTGPLSDIYGGPLRITTNPDLICNSEYLYVPKDGNDRPLDKTDAAVGSTAGTAGVSPTGAATYNIPILIPPGINGMQPAVSITYNSQAGRSVIGKGFNIAGLSSITRTNRNHYFDGEVNGITFTGSDRYLIDGQRLVNLESKGNYGTINSEYRTEQNSFAKITLKANGLDIYFEVKTKDGKTLEYGNTSDSRFILDGTTEPLAWYLKKVTDNNGNFMTYNYLQIGGEILLKSIDYTGNGSFDPFNSVTFYYDKRDDNKMYGFAGAKIKQQHILRKILVRTNDKVTRKYEFNYFQDVKDESCLSEIVESNGAGEQFNSTIFNWGTMNFLVMDKGTFTIPAIPDASYDQQYYTSYDYNNDGLSDILSLYVTHPDAFYYGKIKVHLAKKDKNGSIYFENGDLIDLGVIRTPLESSSGFIFTDLLGIITDVNPGPGLANSGLIMGDFFGKGDVDLFIPYFKEISEAPDKIKFDLKRCGEGPVDNSVLDVHRPVNDDEFPLYTTGDIDNNGRLNIITLEDKEVSGYYNGEVLEVANEVYLSNGLLESYDFKVTNLDLSLSSKPKAIYLGDYNNDGLKDLRVVTSEGIYTFKNNNGLIVNYGTIVFDAYSNLNYRISRQGDFNGDGILDLIIVGEKYEESVIAYGTGNFDLTINHLSNVKGLNDLDTDQDNNEDNVIITDFNYDGLSDLITFDSKYNNENFDEIEIKWYRSNGNGFNIVEQTISANQDHSKSRFYVSGDFNGDGRVDLLNYGHECYTGSSSTTAFRYYTDFNDNFEANRVKSIHNGFNHKTEFKYRPLSHDIYDGESMFYKKGSSSIDKVIHLQFPLYMVETMTEPDGKGGLVKTNYTYEGLRAHNHGKGMLGFEKVTTYNDKTKFKTISSNAIDPTFFVISNQTGKTYYNETTLVSENTTNFGYETFTENPKLIFNHPTTVVNKNKLTGVTITKNNFTYDTFGNLSSHNEIYKESDDVVDATINTSNSYLNIDDGVNYYSRLTSTTVTKSNLVDSDDIKTSTYSYYTDGNLETSNSLGVTVTNNLYDQFGNVTKQTTSGTGVENHVVTYTYDATNRFVKTTTNEELSQTSTAEYNNLGQLISETGVDGLTTKYDYDYWGKLKTVTYPNGKKSHYSTSWDQVGSYNFYTLEQADGMPDVKTYFDDYGRKVRTETTSFGGLMYSDIEYNNKGQVAKTISPYFQASGYSTIHITTYNYDEYGREYSVTNNNLTKLTNYTFGSNDVEEVFPSGKTKKSYLDATGKTFQITNAGVDMSYHYWSDGQLKDASVTGSGSQIDLTYDNYGNRQSLIDPDAGNYGFTHDVYGRLINKTSPIGSYSATFDTKGRLQSETEGGNNITYTYVESGNGINQVKTISDNGVEFQSFEYDEYDRIKKLTEQVGDISMEASYQYDEYGRESAINYPQGFGIKYSYDPGTGELIGITTNTDLPIWNLVDINEHGQITKYNSGNGLQTELIYDANNFLSRIKTGTVQDLTYVFDHNSVVLQERTGLIEGMTEYFDYDNLNQLKNFTANSKPQLNLTMTYDENVAGRMESKSDIGVFSYTSPRPHAITGIDISNTSYNPVTTDTIIYTSYGKVSRIEQGQFDYDFTYGPDHQRKTMEVFQNESLIRKVYYFGNYERHEEVSGTTHLFYIYSPTGLTAIYKLADGASTGDMYYIHKDHLGSIQIVTNQNKAVLTRYYYNAWGVRSNLDAATGTLIQTNNDLTWLHRGFTGHEHLTEIDLINMNGRMYDAHLGMFISPDPHVQAPDMPVNFNRYAYVLNNPLIYTDPSGEFWNLVIGAVIGGVVNWAANGADFTWEGLGYFAVGAVAGAAGAGIGSGVSSALAGGSFSSGFVGSAAAQTATTSFTTGAAIGGSSSFASGFVTGAGNAWLGGDSFSEGLWEGSKTGLISGISGGALGGIFSGLNAVNDGRRFIDGASIKDNVLIDENIPFVSQQGNANCGPAYCEGISQSRGGNTTQRSIRNNLGGDPNKDLLGDVDVLREFKNQTGYRYQSIGRGLNAKEALQYSQSGYDVSYSIRSQGTGHGVVINRITERTITKISGNTIKKLIVYVMDPAVGQYVKVPGRKLTNAYNSFLIYP